MIPVKEDGTLYVELINKLPLNDYMEVMGELPSKQLEYYLENTQMEPATGPVIPIPEEDNIIDLGWGVDADKFLKQLGKNI